MKNKFKALMAYLNPIGLIGANVDMWMDEIVDLPETWASNNFGTFEPIKFFLDYINTIILNLGEELYNRTDKKDGSYWVDVTINPETRKIVLIPKYYIYKNIEDDRHFDLKSLKDYELLSRLMTDMDLHSIKIEYTSIDGYFDCKIYCDDVHLDNSLSMVYKTEVYEMISEILGGYDWVDDGGVEGIMKLYSKDNSGYLYNIWNERTVSKGEQIVLTS